MIIIVQVDKTNKNTYIALYNINSLILLLKMLSYESRKFDVEGMKFPLPKFQKLVNSKLIQCSCKIFQYFFLCYDNQM